MANNERPNLKQIRIKRSVCDRLDERKGKDDSYTDVIKALLDENERLKEDVEELKQDKANLLLITLQKINPEMTQQHEIERDGDMLVLTPVKPKE